MVPVAHPEELEPVKAAIKRFLRYVAPEPARTQVCMYENTPDHDFLVGTPPGMDRLIILGGFSGHGFKFAPIMGEVAADLVSRSTDQPVHFLSPHRFLSEHSSIK